jgi:hypothetical protein
MPPAAQAVVDASVTRVRYETVFWGAAPKPCDAKNQGAWEYDRNKKTVSERRCADSKVAQERTDFQAIERTLSEEEVKTLEAKLATLTYRQQTSRCTYDGLDLLLSTFKGAVETKYSAQNVNCYGTPILEGLSDFGMNLPSASK